MASTDKHCINVSFIILKYCLFLMFVDFTIVFYTVKLTIKCRIKKSYPYLRLVSITPQIFACNIYLPFLGKYLFIRRSNVLLFSASNILFTYV